MKKIVIIGVCLLIAVALVFITPSVFAPTPDDTGNSVPMMPVSTAPDHYEILHNENFAYILTTPKNATENMPLIVYLHGSGYSGSNPEILLLYDGFPRALTLGELPNIPAYVLIPQLPAQFNGWEHVKAELMALIDSVVTSCKINNDKICLTGYSMGATGAWKLAATYPDRFSCLVPISGTIAKVSSNLNALQAMPIWAFASKADTIVSPAYTTDFIDALKATNPNCKATLLETAEHTATWNVYKSTEYNIFQWMLAQ